MLDAFALLPWTALGFAAIFCFSVLCMTGGSYKCNILSNHTKAKLDKLCREMAQCTHARETEGLLPRARCHTHPQNKDTPRPCQQPARPLVAAPVAAIQG